MLPKGRFIEALMDECQLAVGRVYACKLWAPPEIAMGLLTNGRCQEARFTSGAPEGVYLSNQQRNAVLWPQFHPYHCQARQWSVSGWLKGRECGYAFVVLTVRGTMLPWPPFQCCLCRKHRLSRLSSYLRATSPHGGLTVH